MTIESLSADQRLYSVHSAGMSSNLISRKESLKSAAEIQGKNPFLSSGSLRLQHIGPVQKRLPVNLVFKLNLLKN